MVAAAGRMTSMKQEDNMKRYAVSAFVYAILGMVFGVFYREFTKLSGYEGQTTLSVIHTHYFALGMLFFLVVLVIDRLFDLSSRKATRTFFVLYSIGLNLTIAMLFARGLAQALQAELSTGLSASISGMAGIGHALLGSGLVVFLVTLQKVIPTGKS
jgi:hypothetical protein